jgi:hypothetical protein
MEMPEPTQWDNEDSENTTAVELKDFLDSVPYIQSRKTPKGRMKTNFDYRHCDSRPIFLKFNYRELIVFFFHACSLCCYNTTTSKPKQY